MVRDTSILSYIEEQPLGERQIAILNLIKKFPDRTDRELTMLGGFSDPNQLRPRRKELLDYELIAESGKRKCTITNKTVYTWSALNGN